MSENQIVDLKKKIAFLQEHNAQLNMLVKNLQDKIGKMENEIMHEKNKNLMLQEGKKLSENSSKMEQIISNALSSEKAKNEEYKQRCEKLTKDIEYYIEKIKSDEIYIQKLQQDNSRLKKDLLDFSQKHEMQDYINKIKQKELEIQKVGEEKSNMMKDWNDLRDQMEEVLKENRILRQIADVPENFGIDISRINMGDRIKIEDYKAKIRILQAQVDELEKERAQLKYKIHFLSNAFQTNEEPFSILTQEEKVELGEFALKIYNDRKNKDKNDDKDIKYDYFRENRRKDELIKKLENDIAIYKAQLKNKNIPSGIGKLSYNQMDEVVKIIKDNQRDVINMINSKDFSKNNLQTNTKNNFNSNTNNNIRNSENEDNNNIKLKTVQILGEKNLLNNTSQTNNNINNTYINRGKTENNINNYNNNYTSTNYNNINNNDDSKLILNLDQLPPVPLYDPRNPNNTSLSKTFKFNSKFKIEPLLINNLFGIPENSDNIDDIKKMAVALQSQLIEMLEIESRRSRNDINLNNNLKSLFNKYEKLALMIKQIFERYMKNKLEYEEQMKSKDEKIEELNKKIKIQNISDEYKNMPESEKKIKIDILQGELEKLKIKYKALIEEEKQLREYVQMVEKYNLEKEANMRDNITKLKDWKNTLMYYLRFLNEKMKKCVDKTIFDLTVEENKYLREKNSELTLRDIEVTKEATMNQTLLMKYKDLEDSYFILQESKYDIEIELAYMNKRMEELDPEFNNGQLAFRKFLNILSSLNRSLEQIINVFIGVNINDSKNKDNNSIQNVKDYLSFMKELNSSNCIKSKKFFEECLRKNLGIKNEDLNKTDLYYIYCVLNCEDIETIDLRKLMKKIEQYSLDEKIKKNEDIIILENLIKCAQEKNKSLFEAFAYFDTNNNGCITKDEFIYALSQLGFEVTDNNINRLIFLVSGESRLDKDSNIHTLNNLDNFNYIEFCELFEKRAKTVILKNRRTTINKNIELIDWRVNLLTKIYLVLSKNKINIDSVFNEYEKTKIGHISLSEFNSFITHIGVSINDNDIKKLFLSFNHDYNINRDIDPKNYFVITDTIKDELKKIKIRSIKYKNMTQLLFNDDTKKTDINQKYNLLLEEQKFYNIRYNDLEKKYQDLKKNNQLLTVQLQNYVRQNNNNIDKYFNTIEELQQLKLEYMSVGVKRADYEKLLQDNDSLNREVNLLRIGMNTFKELYNTTNYQVKQLKLIEMRNLDELDTYKKAIRQLQSESSQNSLIGRLYYTILVCRWREATTLRKYDDALGQITQFKLDNFALETNNKNLVKDLNDIQNNLHDKIIENIKIKDSLENYENGILVFNSDNEKVYPLDEMRKLVKMLKEDKKNNTEKLLKLRKKVFNLENDNSFLKNEIDFCASLANNIKFNNRDEYSQKLIWMSEDIAKLKLENKKIKREYDYMKESMEYINRINQQLNQSLTEFEKKNVEWENKYRKMEEIFRQKNEQREKNIIEGLNKLKMYNTKKMNNNNNNSNISNNDDSDYNNDNNNNNYGPGYKQNSLIKEQKQIIHLKEQKIKQLEESISIKDREIESLKKLNEENIENLKKGKEFLKTITTEKLVGKEGYEIIQSEEANMMAKTMHKTVKVLQEMLKQKSLEIEEKNKLIDNLHKELSDSKEVYLRQINILRGQISDKDKTALDELQKFIEENKTKEDINSQKNEINYKSLYEMEKFLSDKDNEIKRLNEELKACRIEIKKDLEKIGENNKKIMNLEDALKEEKLRVESIIALNKYENKNIVNVLEEEIKTKNEMIEREKNKINNIMKNFKDKFDIKFNDDEDNKSIQSQKYAQSMQLNEEDINEKNKLKEQNDILTKQINKLNSQIKKYKLMVEDLEKSKNEIALELSSNRKDKKELLELQIKDNKRIDLLKKEKEKLKKENNKLKSELDKINVRLNSIEQDNEKLSSLNLNLEQKLKNVGPAEGVQIPKIEDSKVNKKTKKINLGLHTENQFTYKATDIMTNTDDILNSLCKYCINKNINLKKHLQRYNISKNGKVALNDFKRAIEELKIGFINYDLDKLANVCKLPNSNNISLDNFLNILKNKNPEFKKFLEEFPDENDNIIQEGNKFASRKYDNFENKEFNIDY